MAKQGELILPAELEAQKAEITAKLEAGQEVPVEFSIDDIKRLVLLTIAANEAAGAKQPQTMEAEYDDASQSVHVQVAAQEGESLGTIKKGPIGASIRSADITLGNTSDGTRLSATINNIEGSLPGLTGLAQAFIGGEKINSVFDAQLGARLGVVLEGSSFSMGPLTLPGHEGQVGLRAVLKPKPQGGRR